MNLIAILAHLYKNAKTTYSKNGRNSPLMRKAKKRALRRDKYTCQACSKKKAIMHVHHLNAYAWYPELRFTLSNLITLCKGCHKEFHAWNGGSRVKCTAEDYREWVSVRKNKGHGTWALLATLAAAVAVIIYELAFN